MNTALKCFQQRSNLRTRIIKTERISPAERIIVLGRRRHVSILTSVSLRFHHFNITDNSNLLILPDRADEMDCMWGA